MRKNTKTKASIPFTKPQLQLDPARKQLLHIESGPLGSKPLPHQLADAKLWQHIRLDNRASTKPDIVGSLPRMTGMADKQFHVVWFAAGALEQLHCHEVPVALRELHRVLQYNGLVYFTVYDIQRVAEYVAKGNLDRPLYHGREGVLTALDILFGTQAGGNTPQHHTAFTATTLATKLQEAGFNKIQVKREGVYLWAVAYKLLPEQNASSQAEIIDDDINKKIRLRDELDKAPEIWTPVNFQAI